MTHRDNKRQDYARLYLCVSRDPGLPPFAVCDAKDGHLLAWTNWDTARRHAARCGAIVVEWSFFREHYLPALATRPPAMRVVTEGRHGVQRYHAELTATEKALRELHCYTPREERRTPRKVSAYRRAVGVWPED